MTIAEKIKRAAELPIINETSTALYNKGYYEARKDENARLIPLVCALADCVSALEGMTKYGANDVTINNGERALSRLTQLLPEGEE